MFVFGSIHRAPQSICHRPQFGLVADDGPAIRGRPCVVRYLPLPLSHHALESALVDSKPSELSLPPAIGPKDSRGH